MQLIGPPCPTIAFYTDNGKYLGEVRGVPSKTIQAEQKLLQHTLLLEPTRYTALQRQLRYAEVYLMYPGRIAARLY